MLPSDLQLKAFAEYHGKPQRWDEHSKGYTWEWEGTSATDVLVVVATLATQVLLQLSLKRHMFDTIRQCLEQDTLWRLCAWSAGDALFVVGLLVPTWYTLLPFVFWNIPGHSYITVLKLISLLIVFTFSLLSAVAGWRSAHQFPPDPALRGFPHKLRYCWLFFGYTFCAHLIGLSALLTLLLVMAFPLESVSALALLCFQFLVCVMSGVFYRSKNYQDDKYGYFLFMLLFCIATTCVVYVCVSILFTGSGSNGYLPAFLFTLGSVVLTYWMKKTYSRNKSKEIPR